METPKRTLVLLVTLYLCPRLRLRVMWAVFFRSNQQRVGNIANYIEVWGSVD